MVSLIILLKRKSGSGGMDYSPRGDRLEFDRKKNER